MYYAIISYDIVSDDRRGEVSDLLSTCGARVQLSVFECTFRTKRDLVALRATLRRIIDDNDDQIRIYLLDKTVMDTRTILGRRRLEERADFYII